MPTQANISKIYAFRFNSLTGLAALSTQGLIKEICKLNDEVYNLGVVEAKEMSRGRHLNIFQIPKEPKKKM